MLRKRIGLLIAVVAVLGIGGGGYYFFSNIKEANQKTTNETLQTTTVRRGSITISASGAGTVISESQVDLGFQNGGLLTEVLVEIGDKVTAGDIVAKISDTQARQNLITAKLKLAQLELDLEDLLDTGPEEKNLQVAKTNLDLAEIALDDLVNWEMDEQEIERLQASLDAAEASYQAIKNKSFNDQMASVRISLAQAEQSVADAQVAYNTAWEPARDWELQMTKPTVTGSGANVSTGPSLAKQLENERESAIRNLEKAQQNLELARASYNIQLASFSQSDEKSAWNQVLSAREALEDAQASPEEVEIKTAELAVLQAQISVDTAETAMDISSDQTQFELELEEAQLALEEAQNVLDETTLTSPIDGTVLTVGAGAGEVVGSEIAFISVADINEQPKLEVYMDETDLNNVGVNYKVEVTFDVLPNDVFSGHVVSVDPALVDVNGSMMVRAIVDVDATSYSKPQSIPIGANATVEVIGGRAEDTLILAVEALQEYDTDKYAVFKMVNGEPIYTLVEVGIMDYSFAEITSGLEEGDAITTGIVETVE